MRLKKHSKKEEKVRGITEVSNMRIVYQSKKPKFEIGRDRYQWILKKESLYCYFPTLSLLFDGLAEEMFRNYTIKLKTIKDLDKSINKVYNLIDKVSSDMEKQVVDSH